MTRALRAGALLCAVFACGYAGQAHAALRLCNQTSYVLYAAAGARAPGANLTEGWSRVVPGDCRDVLPQPLIPAPYFLYARSSRAHSGAARAWGGSVALCVKDTNFLLKTPPDARDCTVEDAYMVPFAPLDTKARQSWTTTLTESDAIASPEEARDAGIARLLRDIGYRITDGAGQHVALKRFRAQARLATNSSTSDLFDALETEAMKVSSPAGYSICNDTTKLVWAALALQAGKSTLTAGWWKVPAGGCTHALTAPLTVDKVYVRAESPGKSVMVSGPDKFCTANITFQTGDRTNCAAHGLTAAGFAPTDTKGVTGYTAHVAADGLVPPAPLQAERPK